MTKQYRDSPMKKRIIPANPPDYRQIFSQCELSYGRNFGSKSGYSKSHPQSIFIPNACVFIRSQRCVWRGDVDLSSEDDVQGLIDAARIINKKLFVLREQTHDSIPPHLKSWFVASAILTVWRGQVTAGGDRRCLRGKFSEETRC